MSSVLPSHWRDPLCSVIVGRVTEGSRGGCSAGDVAGVLCVNGLSENAIDDGLDSEDEGGSELRVPAGEPSGVKFAGRSVVAARCWNLPCEFRKRGSLRWTSRAASYGWEGVGLVT